MSELNGRTLGSLTVEELDACPEGAHFGPGTAYRVADGWIHYEDAMSSEMVKDAYVDDVTLHLPGEPEPAPAPKSSPVTTIGRFVVLPLANGGRLALPVNGIVAVYEDADGRVTVTTDDDEPDTVTADTYTFDEVMAAIAKVTG